MPSVASRLATNAGCVALVAVAAALASAVLLAGAIVSRTRRS